MRASLKFPGTALRVMAERERRTILVRAWWRWVEIAYIVLGLRGLQVEVEFPSDWHEHRIGWVRVSLGVITIAVAFPWKWVVPDEGQCSGPRYGFSLFGDKLWLYFGKDTGHSRDPRRYIALSMPWEWRHRETKVVSAIETYPYRYVLRSGAVQERQATIMARSRLWTRPWLPHRRLEHTIDVEFNDEVGERTGSWKGGCMGCGYEMLEGETPLTTLRRMERDRKF